MNHSNWTVKSNQTLNSQVICNNLLLTLNHSKSLQCKSMISKERIQMCLALHHCSIIFKRTIHQVTWNHMMMLSHFNKINQNPLTNHNLTNSNKVQMTIQMILLRNRMTNFNKISATFISLKHRFHLQNKLILMMILKIYYCDIYIINMGVCSSKEEKKQITSKLAETFAKTRYY